MKYKFFNLLIQRQFQCHTKRMLLLLLSCILMGNIYAQERTITGTITDKDGVTLPGVNVVVKGSAIGTITDVDGKYSIKVPDNNAVLTYSYVGYVKQEMTIGEQAAINVTLEEELTQLNEVVVVGYGSMQRSNVTGSISSVKADDIKKVPVPNVVEALRGQIPGVRVTRSSGAPGSDVSFQIRGKRSIGMIQDAMQETQFSDANIDANAPLLVVDGVPFSGGKVSDINPNDIASIDILKDAAATSIYGSSAANGVVLITTKSGATGKPMISVNASTGISDLVQKPELFNGREFAQLKVDAQEGRRTPRPNVPITSVLDPIEIANYNAGNSLDWQDEILQQGKINQAGISINGGTEKFHFYLNGDVYKETAIVPHSTYDRYTARFNADYTPYKWLTVGAKVHGTVTESDETGVTLDHNNDADFTDFTGNSPLGRTRDSLGNLTPTANGDQFQYNPLYRYAHSNAERKGNRAAISPFIEIKPFEGFSYKLNANYEILNSRYTRLLDDKYDAQNLGYTNYRVDFGQGHNNLLDNIVNYSKTFFDKHNINATGVYGFSNERYQHLIIATESNATNYMDLYDIENINPKDTTTRTFNHELNPSMKGKAYYVARLNYAYDNRYNFTISHRWDYSSLFGPNNKLGKFLSLAAAWNIHNEKFLKGNDLVNNLKYRISWGEVGNDRIPEFVYLYSAGTASYAWDGNTVSGWSSGESGNYNLHWETSKQFNTGIDFGLFKNRVSGSFDYYNSKNIGLLFEEVIPIIYGDANGKVYSNVAETKSWGLGAILTGKIIDGSFKWEASVNWSKDKNEIVSLGKDKVDENGKPVDDPANNLYIGQDIDVIKDYKFIGIYQTGEEEIARRMHPDKTYYTAGDPKIADTDGNDTITIDDQIFLGSSVTPDWYGGLTNTFSYKGFELSILIETVQGLMKRNGFYGSLTARDNGIKVNYWTPRNPSNEFPQPSADGIYDYGSSTVRNINVPGAVAIEDASFIAIRNISLSYSLPSSLLKKSPVKGISVYVRGNNLKYFTDLKNAYSPESDYGKFPVTKTWTAGLNLTF